MSGALRAHFANLDGLDSGELWLPLKLINGNRPIPTFEPPKIRRHRDGFDLRGHCEGGEEGKPQALVPVTFRPDKLMVTADHIVTIHPSGELLCRSFAMP